MCCNGCPYERYDYQEGYPTCKLFGDNDEFIYENAKELAKVHQDS